MNADCYLAIGDGQGHIARCQGSVPGGGNAEANRLRIIVESQVRGRGPVNLSGKLQRLVLCHRRKTKGKCRCTWRTDSHWYIYGASSLDNHISPRTGDRKWNRYAGVNTNQTRLSGPGIAHHIKGVELPWTTYSVRIPLDGS